MSALTHKIARSANAPQTSPDEFELSVAQALVDLENNSADLKSELRPLQISAAREVDVRGVGGVFVGSAGVELEEYHDEEEGVEESNARRNREHAQVDSQEEGADVVRTKPEYERMYPPHDEQQVVTVVGDGGSFD